VTVHRDKFRIIKPTRRTNFSISFWNETLHVSDNSSAHHQEFFTVHTAMVYVIPVCGQVASRIRMELQKRIDLKLLHLVWMEQESWVYFYCIYMFMIFCQIFYLKKKRLITSQCCVRVCFLYFQLLYQMTGYTKLGLNFT
jgi:hypothetical protein